MFIEHVEYGLNCILTASIEYGSVKAVNPAKPANR